MSNVWSGASAVSAARINAFAPRGEPQPFTPWGAAAPAASMSSMLADALEAGVEAEAAAAVIDPSQIEADAFAAGFDEGRRVAMVEAEGERAHLARLVEALGVLQPEEPHALGELLAETVDRLVRQIVGEVTIDGAILSDRAHAAAALITEETAPSRMRLHPDDAMRLGNAAIPVAMVADPALAPGTVLLETGDGWIEDGPDVGLEKLRAALDRLGIPPVNAPTGHLAGRAAALLRGIDVTAQGPRRIGKLVSFDGLMMEATGFNYPIGSAARVIDADGRAARAEVVGFRGPRTLLMALDADAPHTAGARVEPDGQGGAVTVGPELLGRVMDALGNPIDGLGPIDAAHRWPLAGRMGNPLDRGRVTEPFDMGVRAVNALLTAGTGQRIAICAGSGVGKSVLMGQMIAGAEADVIVVGLVGERSREVTDFLATKLSGPVRGKSVVVAVPADHPPLLRLRAAMRATAIAEYFRAGGLKVLLLIDSLTRVAHAQREIGLSLGEPPTMKGLSPSALGLIPRLCERAGADARSGGSITALYTVLADGDDTDDPIVDTARAIVDGHIILSRSLAEQGVFPAIDVGKSLSRVMSDIVPAEHMQAAARLRRLWAVYEENRDLILMGAYREGSDPHVDEAIRRRGEVLDFIKQGQKERIDFHDSLSMLAHGFGR